MRNNTTFNISLLLESSCVCTCFSQNDLENFFCCSNLNKRKESVLFDYNDRYCQKTLFVLQRILSYQNSLETSHNVHVDKYLTEYLFLLETHYNKKASIFSNQVIRSNKALVVRKAFDIVPINKRLSVLSWRFWFSKFMYYLKKKGYAAKILRCFLDFQVLYTKNPLAFAIVVPTIHFIAGWALIIYDAVVFVNTQQKEFFAGKNRYIVKAFLFLIRLFIYFLIINILFLKHFYFGLEGDFISWYDLSKILYAMLKAVIKFCKFW